MIHTNRERKRYKIYTNRESVIKNKERKKERWKEKGDRYFFIYLSNFLSPYPFISLVFKGKI